VCLVVLVVLVLSWDEGRRKEGPRRPLAGPTVI